MKKQKGTLLISSPTKEDLIRRINEYYYTDKYSLAEDLRILHPTKDINHNYKVVQSKGRYLFMMIN